MATAATPFADRTPARAPAAAAASRPPVAIPRPIPTWEFAGKRLYRTMEGRVIELPEDMTAEQVATLEAEARAAEKELGKGPPPEPVPEVKAPAAKEATKEPPKRVAKRPPGVRGKPVLKVGAAAAALLGTVSKSKVAQYLATRAAPVLARGASMLSRLKQNEQTHDEAGEKLKQSEDAVVIPPSDEQSKSNAGQVSAVGGRATPVVEEQKAKGKLEQSLAARVPRTIEGVDNFKRNKNAQHVGADVLRVVQGDKQAVVSTFADVTQTPPPMPSDHTTVVLPAEEPAPPTPAMNLGQGVIAPLQSEHTDVSQYTKEADGKLKEEGVTQEQLDMVDSGELAEAKKEKKGLEQKAKAEPLAIQTFARSQTEQIDKDLTREEKTGREALRAKRRTALGATGQRQKGAKSALERKREQVAAKINGIYQAAQDSVKRKLADLETQSMKRFDAGNAAATRAFEDNVKREIDAYKADRYSGWFGWARKAKDWLRGMDHLPRVKEIFETNRATFVDTINRLVEEITEENQRVIKECREELDNAKKTIKEYVDSLGPGLRDIGKQAAAEMRDRLNDLDQTIGRKEEELRNKLKDKQAAAIKAIDEKIEKMKEAMAGALAKLGKLLLWAAKKFFTWALGKFGVSLSTIEGVISKGTAVLKAIFTGPIGFVKNLIGAAKLGFQNFGKNFLTHLKNAVFEWLTGSLEGVRLPETWNLRGILSVVFQLLGLTYQNIRAHLVRLVPEPVVRTLETTFALVKTLITEGPMAAWEQLKEIATEIQGAFVDAVKDWIKWKVVEEAIKTILAMFIPGAGIIRAIIGIYDTIVFFIQKAKDIVEMIGNFLGSIAEIAAGNVGAAAVALEAGLARGLKLVIGFLAKFLRLEGITKRIREVIQNIRAKVDAVIAKVAGWVVGLAKRAGKFVAAKALGGDPSAPPEQRLQHGLREGTEAINRLSGSRVGLAVINPVLSAIRLRHNMRLLQAQPRGDRWVVLGEVNPRGESLTDKLVEPGAGTGNFSTKVTYSPVNALGFGIEMDADPVGPDHPAGSPVSQSLRLELREGVGSRKGLGSIADRQGRYRVGHLLNNHLGGPGNDWRNLTPLTPSANATHYHNAEKDLKTLVNLRKRWVRYEVRAIYSGSSATPGPKVHPLETQFARTLKWSYQLKRPSAADPSKLTNDNDDDGSIKAAASGTVENISKGYPD